MMDHPFGEIVLSIFSALSSGIPSQFDQAAIKKRYYFTLSIKHGIIYNINGTIINTVIIAIALITIYYYF
jgi:hypothetical protein